MADSEPISYGEKQYRSLTRQALHLVESYIATRESQKAYEQAGYRGKSKAAASRVVNWYRPAIEWRMSQIAEKHEGDRIAQVNRVRRVADFNIGDVFVEGLELTERRWKALPREVKACIGRVEVTTTETVRDGVPRKTSRVKIWAKDWARAEELLAKICGHLKPVQVEDVTPAGVLDARTRLEEALARRRRALALGEDGELDGDQ